MDAGFRDEEGYISVMARTDDVINVAGHRLSTGQLEEVVIVYRDTIWWIALCVTVSSATLQLPMY